MRTASPREVNGSAFDRFSLVHFAAGAAAAGLGVPFGVTCAGAIIWELGERPLKRRYPGAFPHPQQDRPVNLVTDILMMIVGWGVMHWATGVLQESEPGNRG